MKPVRRIGIILVFIFMMPVLLFTVYELNSLNEDEEVIKEIYENQLESILFSANQYGDDILGAWVSKIELAESVGDSAITKALLTLNPAIEAIVRYELTDGSTRMAHKFGPFYQKTEDQFKALIASNDLLIKTLKKYQKQEYQKIEPLDLPDSKLQSLVFLSDNEKSQNILFAILIDPELFISETIGPRLQFVAQDRFAILALEKNSNRPVYSTYDSTNTDAINHVLQKDLWLLPNYQLAISTKGKTLESVIRERTKTDLILICFLCLILIIGGWYTFKNVKREVQLAQNKSEFISNVSHELRTPLALISMFAETLDLGRVINDKKRKEYYGIIYKEAQRLTGIVNKILSFSQMDAGKKQLQKQPVDLSELCTTVLKNYEFHLEKEGFVLTQQLTKNLTVEADHDALSEVLINLIDNAIKYSEEDKRIEVKLVEKGNQVVLSVKDFGIGIPKAHQKHIFEKFYRSPTGDLAKKQGTGIGLAIVKQIVDAHNGKIDLHSEPERGSTFHIYFNKLGQNG